jgi:hypothetical protein
MSALVYIVGGIVALLIFTGGVWMSIHRIRGRNSETGDLPTVRLTSRRGDRFTGGFRIRRRPRAQSCPRTWTPNSSRLIRATS